ncbi:MAG: hypothetical protein CL431_08965 [Acidimicrobiaceae bacterium]|jgi:hypothetical protein|nr:hypothetical protein [Acidimicrobiaceae bacterium]
MSYLVFCERCGEDDNLVGIKDETGILVECQTCGLLWKRNLQPKCEKCFSSDVYPAFEAVVLKSRGTQLSVESSKLIYLCEHCDIGRLKEYQQSNSPIMPRELPNS